MAGVITAVISFFFPEALTEGYLQYKPLIILAMLIVRIASGAVLGGVLGKSITDGVIKTGIFRNFKISKK
jgi:energy-coupling factor transport system substrate-specific component